MTALTLLVFAISWLKKAIGRKTGIILLAVYISYLVFKIISAVS
jgi:Ca2+/Na+ antiporter